MNNIYIERLKAYYQLTKPKTVWLLVFVGVAVALLLYSDINLTWLVLLTGILSLLFAIAGTNAVTCWIDRDIDGLMERTKRRPLPRGELTPRSALLFGLSTFAIGCIISLLFAPEATIFLILGFVFSAILYNGHMKRVSPLNILLASPAGMMPVLFMWSYLGEPLTVVPFLIGGLIVLWTPAHIWSLAIFYAKDYQKAKIPMLPLVAGEKTTVQIIGLFNLSLVLVSTVLIFADFFGSIYLIATILLGTLLLILTAKTLINPTSENSWKLFKFTSPYLFLLFLGMVIDRFVSL